MRADRKVERKIYGVSLDAIVAGRKRNGYSGARLEVVMMVINLELRLICLRCDWPSVRACLVCIAYHSSLEAPFRISWGKVS
jgi:hypothetical protein